MTIVSLSFPEQLIKEMNRIQESRGFAGRSEMVRAAIRLMMDDAKEKDSLKGRICALIAVTHDQRDEGPITLLKHQFEEIVKTHIHSKISTTNCVELFLVEGDGSRISSMTKAFQKEEKMKSVKLLVI